MHTVIDATTGKVVLADATDAQYGRWYDHHCFWREPRTIEEVKPELREAYSTADEFTHYLIND